MNANRLHRIPQLSLVVLAVLSLAAPLSAREASFLPDDSPFVGYEMKIPMRDGTHLVGDVYIPKDGGGPFPVVLVQTPYNKANQRPAFAGAGDRWGGLFQNTTYAFVVVDWRGLFASRGAAIPGVRGGNGQDGFDTVAWISGQEWCGGRVGTWGGSALGGAQFKTAAEKPPNLVCIVPSIMPLNLGYDLYFPGGVVWAEFTKFLGRLGWDIYGQLIQQPVKNEMWKMIEANTFIKPSDIRVPTLMVSGWYDLYTDEVISSFEQIRTEGGDEARAHSKMIMGPWLHSSVDLEPQGELSYPGAVGYSAQKTIEFFDHWLRGIDNSFDALPAIAYYQMGTEQWRHTDGWPPESATPRSPTGVP